MKPNLALILAIATALGALPLATEGSWAKGGGGGHGGGGHGGGGHGGGGHGGGGHFGGGHGGGHFGGGHGGKHFGGGHGGRHFGGGHGGGHYTGGHGGGHYAGGHGGGHFAGGRSGNGRNAFGTQGGWHQFAGNGGGGWGGWGGGWGGRGGWVGPVFWPFLLGDIFSYALWPYEYYYPFWSYGTAYDYDYGPYVPAYSSYGHSVSNVYGYTGTAGDSRNDTHAKQIPPEVTQSCGGFAPGVTSFPIDRIREAIHPTGEQVTFLDDLATASSKASAVLNASCPNQPPLTPLARLDAVERRFEATIRAIEIVRPVLATFYDSLNDEQRRRLDAIGAEDIGRARGTAANGPSGAANVASLCSDQAANFTRLPVQRIEEVVKPTGQQQSALEKLKKTSENAADELRGSCPTRTAEAPVARLDEMHNRLDAMVQAAKNVRPTLATFYASLSDEQKAQFNIMGQQNVGHANGGR
jgi:LTXXQ motif family protein